MRKIIIAIWQNTVYGSFLPVILGPKTMDKYKLWTGKRMQFDPNVDPSLENAFATAAYRFGHSLVSNLLRIDKDYFLKVCTSGLSAFCLKINLRLSFALSLSLSLTYHTYLHLRKKSNTG